MSIIAIWNRRKLRFFALLLAVLLCIIVGLRNSDPYKSDIPIPKNANFDVTRNRENFHNPVLVNWEVKDTSAGDLTSNCIKYWNQLMKMPPNRLQNPLPDFSPDTRIYKKSKWMINAKKKLRRKLHYEGLTLNEDHLDALQDQFHRDSLKISQLEEYFVNHITHLRIVGSCLFKAPSAEMDLNSKKAKRVLSSLLPWLKDTKGSIREIFPSSREQQGILFIIQADTRVSVQIDRIARIIRVLRVQANHLPIEIAYSGNETLLQEARDFINSVATSPSDAGNSPLTDISYEASLEYPKQKITFLNVDRFIREDVMISSNLVYSVAVIHSGFKNAIVMTSQTIPMTANLKSLFQNEEYQSQGVFFFKERPLLESKVNPFPAGFFEINELVNRYAAVDSKQTSLFNLKHARDTHTKRVTEMGFQRLLDPSMAIINREKAISGLLITSVLPFHEILKPKYDISSVFNPELLWLGQELSGSSNYVPFSKFFASAPGVLTPHENLPASFLSKELCSSSWSQLWEEDGHLLYVTSHQLENHDLPEFLAAVRSKLTVKKTTDDGKENWDESLAQDTVGKNILFIKDVLQPASIDSPIINNEGQPFVSSEHVTDFGKVTDYWCAYDIVGGYNLPYRGLVYEMKEKDSLRFLLYLSVWLQNPVDKS